MMVWIKRSKSKDGDFLSESMHLEFLLDYPHKITNQLTEDKKQKQ